MVLLHGGPGAPDERLAALGCLFTQIDGVDLAVEPEPLSHCDARGHAETWADMLRCQDEGLYPAAFSAIEMPLLMLHGEQDPHPGALIAAGLAKQLPQLQFVSLPRCGHSPWLERAAREPFIEALEAWVVSVG